MWQHILLVGVLMSTLVLGVQAYALDSGKDNWQTLVFTTLTFTQLAHVMAIRSDREALTTIGLFSNPLLLGAVVVTVGLQLLLIYVPLFNDIFDIAPLTPMELGLCGTCTLVILFAVELEKWLIRKGLLYAKNG
jgi:Ca2+-transporting ATPase